MKTLRRVVSWGLVAAACAGAALTYSMMTSGAEMRAQVQPAPCACSRVTPLEEAGTAGMPGPAQPRVGVVHCQCGAATCVSQISYAAPAAASLFCVK